jgi:hypothetical protein
MTSLFLFFLLFVFFSFPSINICVLKRNAPLQPALLPCASIFCEPCHFLKLSQRCRPPAPLIPPACCRHIFIFVPPLLNFLNRALSSTIPTFRAPSASPLTVLTNAHLCCYSLVAPLHATCACRRHSTRRTMAVCAHAKLWNTTCNRELWWGAGHVTRAASAPRIWTYEACGSDGSDVLSGLCASRLYKLRTTLRHFISRE